MSICDNETTGKIDPDVNPTATTRTINISLRKLAEVEAYLLDEIEVREQIAKKKISDSIQSQASWTQG